MNEMTFGVEGPNLNGTWFNPKTNQYITVRDTMFEDNNLIVLTTDGKQLNYNVFQDYIRAEKMPGEKEVPKIQANLPVNENSGNDLPLEVTSILDDTSDNPYKDLMLPEDSIGGNLYGDMPATSRPEIHKPIIKEDANSLILNKILGNKKLPSIKIDICRTDLPTEVISVAKDMLGVTSQEIIDWYINKLDINTLMESLRSNIESAINELGGNVEVMSKESIKKESELSIDQTPTPVIEIPKPKRAAQKTPSRKGVKKTISK